MRGNTVIVRAYGDEPLALKVWETTEDRIYVCDDERYQRLLVWGAKPDCFPVAFPRENVYHYDKKLFDVVKENHKSDPSVWNKLKILDQDQ